MQTDYKNLTLFEVASVIMIAIGIAIIAVQVIVTIGPDARETALVSLAVLDMQETVADATSSIGTIISFYNDYAVGGTVAFMDKFYQASDELAFQPITQDARVIYNSTEEVFISLVNFSDQLATNYQNNYVSHGVDASVGGQIMGAYIERLSK